jgi:hypothetical protein
MHLFIVYSGLVPMSPKTTPKAPRQRAALAPALIPEEGGWDIAEGGVAAS